MRFKQKMLTLCVVPLLLLTVLSLVSGMAQFRSGMYEETESRLKSSALAAMNLYDSQGYGNYAIKEDGNVWRGMNFNISKETSLVDSLKEQTEVDITFFFQDTAVMTSICNQNGARWIGMMAGENIKKYTLHQGAQLWYRNIDIDGEMCHAYIIPIVQPGDGSVIGALMASVSTQNLESRIKRYIGTSAAVCAAVLIAVAIVIFCYIGSLTKVIHNVREVLLKVSEGDLTDGRLAGIHRRDEFGELSSGTEKLRIKMAQLMEEIRVGVEKLTQSVERLNVTLGKSVDSAREMNRSVEEINVTANNQKQETESAESDVETTRQAIDQMLKEIADISVLSEHMAQLSTASKDILDELFNSSRESQDTVKNISQQVTDTDDSVQQIRSVTEYIINIADETNLLALNASIEAARAGEAGRGFAVVATQIQKLAEESNNSVSRIEDNIQMLVEKITGIVSVMGTVGEALQKQEQNVNQTKDIFDKIHQDVMEITYRESNMQYSVSGMNQAKDNMSHIITELSESARNNANLSENAADMTTQMMHGMEGLEVLTVDLTELANRLDRNLKSFRLD
ncbi:MAG: methyl-accepting chemotaxis protein [Lachnospiraceae bacterium]